MRKQRIARYPQPLDIGNFAYSTRLPTIFSQSSISLEDPNTHLPECRE